ncbi:hypothetical protein SCHPADRAFT_938994 [Schizopora paradoxa]|uniref:BTB domain-containing protein n=1 Tax=Schizopora paradoxa TaxID=27342 RepID=A0A0H2RTH0_9AGAM|nr:hypothetical protein SCHPADRAFT_938994 [Schizopora paradoxa]
MTSPFGQTTQQMASGKQASLASATSSNNPVNPSKPFSFNFGEATSSTSTKNARGPVNSSQSSSFFFSDSSSVWSDQTKVESTQITSRSSPTPLSNSSGVTTPVKGDNKNVERKILGAIPHPDFTFEDGNITFQIGHMTFTIHRYILIMFSQTFRDMISLGPQSTTEGTPEHPIILHHLDPLHFEKFLRILYPCRFDELPFSKAADWYSVLLVADMFNFTECGIRNLAISQLTKTASCVEKIVWGQKFGIKTLQTQGYLEVCNRNETLKAQELVQLLDQPQTIELIMKKREAMHAAASRYVRVPISEDEVNKFFKEQLRNAH